MTRKPAGRRIRAREEIQKAATRLLGILRSPQVKAAVKAFNEFTALSLSRKHLLGYKAELECGLFLVLYTDPHTRFKRWRNLEELVTRLARIRMHLTVETD